MTRNYPTTPKTKQKKTKTSEPLQWFLGENKKHVVIAVKDEEAVFLQDESLQFLSNILGACQLNLADVAIINYSKQTISYTEITEKLAPAFLLLFEVSAKEIQLPFTVPHYQIQKYDNCHFLLAPSLFMMQGDSKEAKLEKSKLWLSLKKMFSV